MQAFSFSELRGHLKEIMDNSADQHEVVIIKRPRGENMILMSQSDYESMKETAYLLSSEANAKHLHKSLRSLKAGKILHKNILED